MFDAKNTIKSHVILTLIFPISSFINALRNPKSNYFKIVFILFYTFIGLAFFYSGTGADISRYLDDFHSVASMKSISFFEYFRSRAISNQIDYYSSFSWWLISRFTSNNQLFLGILAFVYAFFFANNVVYIINHCNLSVTGSILFILLIMSPSMALLTHRWWTALQVFLFGALPIVYERKFLKIIWCVIASTLVHFSFIYPLIILILCIFLPQKNLFPYLIVFVASTLLDSIDFNVITPYIENYLPELTVERTMMYINAEELEHNWFSKSAKFIMKFSHVIIVVWIYVFGSNHLRSNNSLRLSFVVSIMIGGFANIANFTEWGWRYFDLSDMLLISFYMQFLTVSIDNLQIIKIFRFCNIGFLYVIFFQIRGAMAIIGPNQFFWGNYFTTWMLSDTTSLLDVVKDLLK